MYLGRIVERGTVDGGAALAAPSLHAGAAVGGAAHRRLDGACGGDPPARRNPVAGNPPAGCHFHPRCPHAAGYLPAALPGNQPACQPTHTVSCHFAFDCREEAAAVRAATILGNGGQDEPASAGLPPAQQSSGRAGRAGTTGAGDRSPARISYDGRCPSGRSWRRCRWQASRQRSCRLAVAFGLRDLGRFLAGVCGSESAAAFVAVLGGRARTLRGDSPDLAGLVSACPREPGLQAPWPSRARLDDLRQARFAPMRPGRRALPAGTSTVAPTASLILPLTGRWRAAGRRV